MGFATVAGALAGVLWAALGTLGEVWPALLMVGGIVVATWRLEDRFTPRREFKALAREVSAIRRWLGVPAPSERDDPPEG